MLFFTKAFEYPHLVLFLPSADVINSRQNFLFVLLFPLRYSQSTLTSFIPSKEIIQQALLYLNSQRICTESAESVIKRKEDAPLSALPVLRASRSLALSPVSGAGHWECSLSFRCGPLPSLAVHGQGWPGMCVSSSALTPCPLLCP